MDKKRRDFLKLAGVFTLAGLGGTITVDSIVAGASPVSSRNSGKGALSWKRFGLIIDLRKFKDHPELIERVVQACHQSHNVPEFPVEEDKVDWVRTTGYESAFGEQSTEYNEVLVMCNHCESPPCVQDCPTRATFKNKDGVVVIDHHRCIGCQLCITACPYGMRRFNRLAPRDGLDMNTVNRDFPTRRLGVVESCNFCAERLAVGKEPVCVEVCKQYNAMIFGDLNDPQSEISVLLKYYKTIQCKPLGPRPSVFYIV